MTKRYDEPIDVAIDPIERAPVSFRWRGRRYEIDQRLSSWKQAQWNGRARGDDRDYLRVLAHPAGTLADGSIDADGCARSSGAVYDLYVCGRAWRLGRVWD